MSLVGLVQLTERLLNQTLQNSQENPQGAAKNAGTGQNAVSNRNTDTFVPSGQNGVAEAGIFQVTQVSLFSAAADLLLAQPQVAATPTTAATPAAATVAAAAGNDANAAHAANTAAATTANANTGAATIAAATNAAAANAATGAIPVATDAGTAATASAQAAQAQLANLNASLAAFGLSQDEITVVDRVAKLTKDFNPQAFTDIINQLQALAQAQAPQPAAAPGVAARAAAA